MKICLIVGSQLASKKKHQHILYYLLPIPCRHVIKPTKPNLFCKQLLSGRFKMIFSITALLLNPDMCHSLLVICSQLTTSPVGYGAIVSSVSLKDWYCYGTRRRAVMPCLYSPPYCFYYAYLVLQNEENTMQFDAWKVT